jgi:hypothetical protein
MKSFLVTVYVHKRESRSVSDVVVVVVAEMFAVVVVVAGVLVDEFLQDEF